MKKLHLKLSRVSKNEPMLPSFVNTAVSMKKAFGILIVSVLLLAISLATISSFGSTVHAQIDDQESGWPECNGWLSESYDKYPCRETTLRWADGTLDRFASNLYNWGLPDPPSGDRDSTVGSDQDWYDWGLIEPSGRIFLSEGTACAVGPTVCRPTPTPTPTPPATPTSTPTPSPTPVPDCTLNFAGESTIEMDLTSNKDFTAAATDVVGTIEKVSFSTENSSISIDPEEDPGGPFLTNVTADLLGSSTLTAEVYIDGAVRCEDTVEITVIDITCSVDLNPDSPRVEIEGSAPLFASIEVVDGTVDYAIFTAIGDPAVATIDPVMQDNDGTAYETLIESLDYGTIDVRVDVEMVETEGFQCTDITTVTVVDPGPWWQIIGGDAMSSGSIYANIPSTCKPPVCEPVFIKDNDGYPGVPSSGDTLHADSVSSTGWAAEYSPYSAKTHYDYDFFKRKLDIIPENERNIINANNSVGAGRLKSGGKTHNGYALFEYFGEGESATFTINGDLNLTSPPPKAGERKVVLFVNNADLIIDSEIRVTKGKSFFMAIVDGDIIVNPSIGVLPEGPLEPNLEGIFYAYGQFKTGTAGVDLDNQLYIRGSVSGFGYEGEQEGIVLERNLPNDSTTPAELFEFASDQLLLLPRFLSTRRYDWREVAP